jgi:hypothetical protein
VFDTSVETARNDATAKKKMMPSARALPGALRGLAWRLGERYIWLAFVVLDCSHFELVRGALTHTHTLSHSADIPRIYLCSQRDWRRYSALQMP